VYKDKKVLLIGGGGTLGTYVAEELLKKGCYVDIICPEDKQSENKRLRFYKEYATQKFLQKLLLEEEYNGIVNFIHYPDVEEYKPIHKLLIAHTEHLIFLSSYRVYADLQHPIVESAPMLLDITKDEAFLKQETYALAKARAEHYLWEECKNENWTIVRPVISFSDRRMDLVMYSGHEIIDKAKAGVVIPLPREAKYLTAGLDWAGNSGKLIANLLFKKEAVGEAYTISTAQNLTWGELAEMYTRLVGAKFEWIDSDTYFEENVHPINWWAFIYDRLFDRTIDNTKVLSATGLKKEDFLSIEEGMKIEINKICRTFWNKDE